MMEVENKSKLEVMLEGNTLEIKKLNAAEFVALGGIGINDPVLEPAGLANNIRASAVVQERIIKMLPIFLNEHNAEIKEMVDAIGQKIDLFQKKPQRKISNVRSICPTSITIGIILGFLATIGISWFWVIPSQIAAQRGSDWAIGEYLATPEGRAVRKYFRKCQASKCQKL
jgi:hypothetical protein